MWKYLDQDGVVLLYTEEEILDEYYEFWSKGMLKVGKLPMAIPATCIEDWVTVHWAVPA